MYFKINYSSLPLTGTPKEDEKLSEFKGVLFNRSQCHADFVQAQTKVHWTEITCIHFTKEAYT